MKLIGSPAVAEHLHLEQHLAGDVSGQDGLDHHRPDADVDLGRAKRRGVDGDEHVAGARQAEASGEGVAVDASNYRLSQLGHQDKQVDEEVAAVIALEAGHLAVEAAEVGSGAEHASGSGQDHDADVGLVAAPGKR